MSKPLFTRPQHVLSAVLLAFSLGTFAPQTHAENTATPAAAAAPNATGSAEVKLPDGVKRGPAIEGTAQYTLPNGLTVLLSPDDSKASVTVNMTYKVGSRHENYGETGMAHLLEHMLFRGTPSLPNALAEFSRRGLRANGTTTSDRTNYYATFAADPKQLDWYIRWQADAMVNAKLDKNDFDAEMTVVRNEMEAGENNPFEILTQQTQAAAYQWHNYGHDTIGARSDVEQVDLSALRAFYKTYYQPDNAVLIVSGKFDPDQTLTVIADAFGALPRPERQLKPEHTIEPVQQGEREIIVRRQGGNPLIAAQYHIPQAASPDFIPMDLGASMLADTPSGRLYKALVQQKLAAHVFGYARPMRQPGYALFGAQLENDMDARKALDVLTTTLESVGSKPLTQDELDRIKQQWLTQWSEIYAQPAALASALSEASAAGDWRLFFWQRDQVKQTTLDAVQKVVSQYLLPSNRTTGLYLPQEQPKRAPASKPVDIDALLKGYTGEGPGTHTAAFDPSPANINQLTQRENLNLPNGAVQLALLPKPTRGDRVEAQLVMQFANADLLKGYRTVAVAAADLLDRGTKQYSRQELSDRFDALQADVNFGGGAGSVVAHISTVKANLPEVISLVVQVLRQATFPQDELDTYKSQIRASIVSAMSEPGAKASRALARHDNPWAADDVRYVPTFEESLKNIDALTREQLVKFHDKFYGAGTLRLAAVGAFDAQAVREALRTSLEGWHGAPAYQRIADPYRRVTPKQFTINTPDKANAVYLSFMPLQVQDTNPDFTALQVANYILGGSSTSRLWERIRVKEGISYDVRSSVDASAYEPSGEWSMSAILAPQNRQRFTEALNEELNRALKDGFTKEEVSQAVTALLNLRKLNRSNDGVLASAWMNYLQEGRTFDWSARIDQELESLTADQVNAALRKYLKPDQFSTALAGDFK